MFSSHDNTLQYYLTSIVIHICYNSKLKLSETHTTTALSQCGRKLKIKASMVSQDCKCSLGKNLEPFLSHRASELPPVGEDPVVQLNVHIQSNFKGPNGSTVLAC